MRYLDPYRFWNVIYKVNNVWSERCYISLGIFQIRSNAYQKERNITEGPANWKNLSHLWSHQTFTKAAANMSSRLNTKYTNLGCKKKKINLPWSIIWHFCQQICVHMFLFCFFPLCSSSPNRVSIVKNSWIWVSFELLYLAGSTRQKKLHTRESPVILV